MGDGEKGTAWRTHSPLAATGTGRQVPISPRNTEVRRSWGTQEMIIKPELEHKATQVPSCSQLIKSRTQVSWAPSRRQAASPPPASPAVLPPANESVTPQSSKVCVVTVSIIYLFTRLQFSACLSNSIID